MDGKMAIVAPLGGRWSGEKADINQLSPKQAAQEGLMPIEIGCAGRVPAG
jgi:hypothetical protein